MLSGLDLLKGTNAQSTKTGLDLLKDMKPAVSPSLELLKQSVATESPTTIAPPDIHPAAAYLEKFTKPPTGELEAAKYQMGPLITAENTAPAMDTLGRLWNLAQHPYDVVKGAAVFASEIPGFIGGLASAIGQVPIEILKGGSVLDWYNASARNMQTISGLWHRGVSAPLGKLLETPEKMGEELAQTMFGAEPEVRKDEAEMVGEIFMVPYTASSAPLHAMADSPTWDDHPNVRGLLKFTADALGLVTMGLVLKGGPVMASRRAEPIVKRAHDIDTREKAIDASGLDEIIKTAQKKVLDAEKTQLELEIESLKKELDHEKLAKEDLKEKGKEVEGIKEGVETEAIREERLRFAEEKAKEIPEEKVKTGIKLIKKMPPKPVEIPDFKHTEEALAFGEVATPKQIEILESKRAESLLKSNALRDKGDPQGAMDEAVRGQLFREAIEAYREGIEEPIKIYHQTTEAFPEGKPEFDAYFGDKEFVRVFPGEFGPNLVALDLPKSKNIIDLSGETKPSRQFMADVAREIYGDKEKAYIDKLLAGDKDAISDFYDIWTDKALITPVIRKKGYDGAKFGEEYILLKETIKDLDISEVRPTDLDFQTGVKEPPALSTESSPFRETPERTQMMKDIYAEKAEAVRSNPELMTNKLLNDVNRWLDGEELPVEKAKNDLSELAARAEELERSFISRSDFLRWKDTVSSAADWARKADRPKFERTIEIPEERRIYEIAPEDITKYENTDLFLSSELEQLHNHKARTLGFEKVGGSLVEGYLKLLAKAAEKVDMDLAIVAHDALSKYKKGDLTQAALDAENVIGKIHAKEVENITSNKITETHKGSIQEALESGRLTPEEYTRLHEKDYGPLEEFKKERLKIERPEGLTLYTGLPLDEAVKQLKEMAKHTAEFMKEFKGSFKEKEFDFDHAVKQVKADTLRSLWDQSETLLNIVKNKYPAEYDRIVSRQRSAVTGIGYGKVLYGQAVKEIYGRMSKEMVEAVNAYILARRFKDIYGYRTEKGYKHQPGYGAKQSITTSTMIEMIKDIPPDAWKDLASKVPEAETLFGKLIPEEMASVVKAGDAYFEWSRKIIDDLVEIGIKSPEEGALLKAHDFRKFKTMLIKKLYDFNYDLQLKGETIKVSNSGVLELGSGSSKILEPDSRVVLSEQMARAYGSIAHQAAALEWKGLADRHPDNGFVSVKKQAGWSPIPYMADGVRKNIYFHPDVIKYLVTRSRDISPRLALAIRGLTMAPVTRALAVGLSPIWSTFAGLPMDIMHSLWAARTWEADAKGVRPKASFPFYETRDGKFRKVYSPFAGVDALQIGLDMKRTFKDVYSRGPLTENLMKHGLVMNFLTQRMNRYMKGVKPPGDWAKTMDVLSYHGLSMELWARVATADRVIRRDAKKLGITYEQALKNDDIMYRAAHAGRDRMDYNQGGWFVKALDQSGMIFLNAAVLGTRTFWRQAKDNPVDFTFRTAQLGITAAGLTAAAWSLYPEVMKDQSASANKRDVTWPIAPDWLKVKDIDGNDVTFHFKLRMDPNAAFLYRAFEGLTKTYMYDQGLILEEPDYKELVETLKHLGPVDVKLPPAIQASVDYVTNYSWWRDRQMYTELGGKTFDWPQSQYEGMYDPRVPQIAKDVAGVTKLSPKRLAGTTSNIIPSNNEFVWLMNGAYEQAFSDLPEEVRRQHWLITLAETPGFNKVIGMTRHGQGRWKVKSDIENEIELKQMVMNSKFDMLATQNTWYGVRNEEKLFKFMEEQEFDDYNRMVDIFKFIKDPVVKSLPHRDFWLSMGHSSIEGRAKIWVELLDRSSEAEKRQLLNEMDQVMIVGGVVTPEFMKEVEKFRNQSR